MEHRGFRVMAHRCDQCLFSRSAIVDEERKASVLADTAAAGTFFQCHKATIGGLEGGCCRAFFDIAEEGLAVAVKRLGLPVQWIDPETLEEASAPSGYEPAPLHPLLGP